MPAVAQFAPAPDRSHDQYSDRAQHRGDISDQIVRRHAENRRGRVELERDLAIEKPLQQGMNGRIGLDHVARDPPEQECPQPDQNRKPVKHHHDQRRTGDDHGNADGKAEDQQRKLPVRGRRDRDDIVQTHDDVGDHDNPDRVPKTGARGDVVAFIFRHQKLGCDHRQRNAADQLQIGQRHQRRDDAGERDQQDHRDAGADHHAPQALPRMQPAARHRDDQRIVAGQQHVDPDDLANREPERRLLQVGLKLRKKRPDIRGIKDLQQPIHSLSPWRNRPPPQLVSTRA